MNYSEYAVKLQSYNTLAKRLGTPEHHSRETPKERTKKSLEIQMHKFNKGSPYDNLKDVFIDPFFDRGELDLILMIEVEYYSMMFNESVKKIWKTGYLTLMDRLAIRLNHKFCNNL
ncbi:MAG: hypothetical protein GY853_14605 [PVC group bacterium]|nr:hypothetical protein [PVC group bacterium]